MISGVPQMRVILGFQYVLEVVTNGIEKLGHNATEA